MFMECVKGLRRSDETLESQKIERTNIATDPNSPYPRKFLGTCIASPPGQTRGVQSMTFVSIFPTRTDSQRPTPGSRA